MDPSTGWDDDQVGPGLAGLERQGSEDGLPGQDLELRACPLPNERPSAIEIHAGEFTHYAVPVAGTGVAAFRVR